MYPEHTGLPVTWGPADESAVPQLLLTTGGVGWTAKAGQSTTADPFGGMVTVAATVKVAGSLSQHGFGGLQFMPETLAPTTGRVIPEPPVR
ncbi:MAG: hypothetical protein IPP49_21185 [Saprospiraceae bacterium]|nr:hypothetical protein [Saprospiraceae bacterium]